MSLSANMVLFRLGEIAVANIGDFLTEAGDLDLNAVREWGHLLESVEITKDGWKLRLASKVPALALLGKHLGLF
jgi:hypothetical protein